MNMKEIKEGILGFIIIIIVCIFLFNRKDDSSSTQRETVAEKNTKIMTEDESWEYMNACLENSFEYSNLIRYEEEVKLTTLSRQIF